MTWLKENWLKVMIFFFIVLTALHFYLSSEYWIILSTAVLAITAVAITVQAEATKEASKNQVMPIFDVSMIFHKEPAGTFLQFWNIKGISALIWLTISFSVDGKEVSLAGNDTAGSRFTGQVPIRAVGAHIRKTSSTFFKSFTGLENSKKDIRAKMRIELAPIFNKKLRTLYDVKVYKFNFENQEWVDADWWGMPDPIHPKLEARMKTLETEKLLHQPEESHQTTIDSTTKAIDPLEKI